MRALALETSGSIGSIAIVENGEILAEETFAHGLKHAAQMTPRIDAMVRAVGWRPADAREIYVSVGPGSFTGLRIGVTFAKTLAFVTGARIAAVPTVESLARNAPPDARNVIIVLDAKRDQIFTARLARAQADDDWRIAEPAHLDSLAGMISRTPRPVHLLGEGLPWHEKFLPTDRSGIILTPPDLWRSRAAAVAQIGHAMARAGRFTDPLLLAPLYIRKPEAEEKLEAREAQSRVKDDSPRSREDTKV